MEKVLKIKKAFTLVEVLIVMSILGILVALVVPVFKDHIIAAKESAAKDDLRILRSAIQLYAVQHNGVPPGYINNDTAEEAKYTILMIHLLQKTLADGAIADVNADEPTFGPYLSGIPENPFNKGIIVWVLHVGQKFPAEEIVAAEGNPSTGWIYSPELKEIKINKGGVDSEGVPFSTY